MTRTLRLAHLTFAWLIPVVVIVQAVLSGQSLFAGADLFGLHGGLGHGVLGLSVLTAGIAWAHPDRWRLAPLATLTVLALIAQIGLGYTGHRSGVAAASAVHVPLGVAVAVLGTAVAARLTTTAGSTSS